MPVSQSSPLYKTWESPGLKNFSRTAQNVKLQFLPRYISGWTQYVICHIFQMKILCCLQINKYHFQSKCQFLLDKLLT